MSSYPRNYPFYNWVPKWLGILILVLMFIPILTVGGVYSVNSTEMMSGLGIISEHVTHQHVRYGRLEDKAVKSDNSVDYQDRNNSFYQTCSLLL